MPTKFFLAQTQMRFRGYSQVNPKAPKLIRGGLFFFLAALPWARAGFGQVPEPQTLPAQVEADSTSAVKHDTVATVSGSSAKPNVRQDTAVVKPMKPIIVVGHYQGLLGSADAASSGTYTKELLEDRPLLRPGEVEELVPGLIVTQHSGAGKANQFLLRGFNLDHGTDFATSVDGVPVNLPTHAHGQGYDDLNFLLPEFIDHVDYTKGPYDASRGDFASAGAADIYYENSVAHPFLDQTLGAFGYNRSIGGASADLFGGKLLLGIEALHEDGPWDVPEDYRKFNELLRWSHPLGSGLFSLEGMAYSGTWNATNQIPERAVTEGAVDYYGTLDSSDGGSSHRYSFSTAWDGELGGGALRANAYAVKYDMNLYSNFTFFLDDTVNGDQMEQLDNRWIFGTSERWTKDGSVLGWGEKLRLGLDARYDDIAPVALYHTMDRMRLNPWAVDTVQEPTVGYWTDLESHFTSWSRLYLGLRYAFLGANVQASNPANSGWVSEGILLPKASLILGPWAKTEFYLNFGDGYHSNDARGATATIDAKSGETISQDSLLVRSRGFEIGGRSEAVPGLQSSLALWLLDFNSELVWDADEGTTEPAGPTRRMGIEINEHYQPVPWLLFDLDLAFSRARFVDPDSEGQYVPEAIESAVSAGVSLHRLGPWSAGLFMRFFGPRALTQDNSVRSSSSTLFNGQITCALNRHVSVYGDVFNIFDTQVDDMAYDYVTRLPGEPADGVDDLVFHPAEPRQFRGGLTIRL